MSDNNLFGLASFVIATIGVVASILAFMMVENKAVRYAGGSACLFLTLLFSIVGLSSFFSNEKNTSPGTTEIATNTPNSPPQISTPTQSSSITPTATPTNTPTFIIRADDVIPKIKGEDGELQRVLDWWREDDYGRKEGLLNPASVILGEKCFGMAWNTSEYGYHQLIVFQKPTTFTFADGGWYTRVCMPDNITISPEDVGRIQADWLGKRNGIDDHPWEVTVSW